jgi:hypothetical protein
MIQNGRVNCPGTNFFDRVHLRKRVSGIISEADYETRFTKILK